MHSGILTHWNILDLNNVQLTETLLCGKKMNSKRILFAPIKYVIKTLRLYAQVFWCFVDVIAFALILLLKLIFVFLVVIFL